MSRVFHRDLRATYPVAVRGEGIHLIDARGERYIDACGGAAVSCLGHDHPAVLDAIKSQLSSLAYAHTSFFTTEALEELADELVASAPTGLTRVYFTSGGSEAVEAAIKLARQYALEIGEPERDALIARRQSYHGNTLGALATGGHAGRRRGFEPLLRTAAHVSACYAYRGKRPGEDDDAYAARLADELEARIEELGAGRVAAVFAETVVGATAGAVPPVPGYFRRVREICDRHGVLLVLDEVMCGMGRTGTLHACEQEGVTPDLITVAKGLGAGYQPIGAVLVSERIYEAILRGSGSFRHGHTYMGHPLACAAALAVQRTIRKDGLLEAVRARGDHLDARLRERLGDHPHVGDIRGRGLLRAIELVRDRDSKEPFEADLRLHQRIRQQAMARGLMVYPGGGTADGERGDHVLLAPPFVIDDEGIDEIADRLAAATDAAIAAALKEVS
jgi:adenosylmethionine-8-amino-7-oxononanoate aminotransferase